MENKKSMKIISLIVTLSTLVILSQCLNSKVKLNLYTESLCPDCINFITGSLKKAHNTKGFYEIAQVNLFPYGKTNQTLNGSTYEFSCQHGSEECKGNLVEVCAQHFYSNFDYISFVICFEENVNQKGIYPAGNYCAKTLNLNFSKVKQCSESSLGNKLEHFAGLRTESLNPKLSWIPWVVANGKHTTQINTNVLDNMLKFACENYNGETVIPACQIYKKRYF